ncbi:MAG: TetR/AcrR family transcriptional regulator [Proteobacteria bacterium]|nr:TetR/AcrR family transcriptional regulator [Pseudomonadota bacterium]
MSYLAERREEEKERRRLEIIEAAELLYAEKGWDAVTMDQVARTARLSRALLYVYFRDKEDLLFAITSRALEELRQRFERAIAGQALGIDQMTAIGRAYVLFQQEKPFQFDACSRYHAHHAHEGQENELACAAQGDGLIAVMIGVLQRGIADGSIRADIGDPVKVCVMLWAFSHGLIQIATNKSVEIARQGVSAGTLMEDGQAMLRYLLAVK